MARFAAWLPPAQHALDQHAIVHDILNVLRTYLEGCTHEKKEKGFERETKAMMDSFGEVMR